MRAIPFVVAALLIVPGAFAAYITINAQLPETFTENNTAQAKFAVSNSGDETAFSVRTSFRSDITDPVTLFLDKLEPDRNGETSFVFNISKEILPGRYPMFVVTEYADANNYPFSAVSMSFLTYRGRTSSDVNGVFEEIKIPKGGSAKARLKIANSGAADRNVDITVFVPKELLAGGYDKKLLLKSGEQKYVDVDISSFSALQNSTYTIFAAMEYDNSEHYSSVSRGSAAITKEESVFSDSVLGFAVAILAAATIAYNVGARKR
ncbi:MAG: hypothetical protein HY516_04400 [Candidatus Aenigmarchaeota archaeon]|nr:hypothetical protein [Candidatus Aenigmarchaeota archaeon]